MRRIAQSKWAGRRHWLTLAIAAVAVGTGGCEAMLDSVGEINSYLDPSQPTLIPKHSAPLALPILDTLDPTVEEPNEEFPTATDIQPDDLVPPSGDYVVGVNDVVSVEIYDLLGEGTGATVKNVPVSETGYISLDFIPPVYAVGRTAVQLQDDIRQAYSDAGQIRNARVTVTVVEEQSHAFSATGNVGQAGRYPIIQNDYHLLDALIACHGPASAEGVEYAYVIRQPPFSPPPPPPSTQPTTPSPTEEQPETPPTGPTTPTTQLLAPPQSEANPDDSPAAVHMLSTSGDPAGDAAPAPITQPTSPAPAGSEPNGLSGFKFNTPNPVEARIIRVPLRELLAGQIQYNIIIRAGDTIFVPDPVTGEYYMGGNIARPGPYSLTARNITLKEAVISAGMFSPIAIPGRTEIVRRIGQNKEVVVRLDLDQVMGMQQPDIFLKPYDEVFVGTNVWAPFLADFRNAFTVTYGLGFTYDRNYSPQNTGTAF